ncbi:Ubiquinone/menaquinone biosynthesis methyltransferase UbiE [Liberibacter crescens BT-1]|uniref:Ubiquinone/menaquinone biosynthesis C-methyltransferase UbiE n=1 Tax=Liberibacter crescens (strain BT-1) TaxID=1215343 RepID=L0EXT1_LIBCB|nr:bifunctional demethylmenaquinone methyltransferase/2-methoxy-6-polyprenyl-1,4-benzoquinol methylase UbiE [Liberibacter crescens]AGA65181.1 Ubiquinone/menaquinone biosynthesis methyltransferase UbiE [Liberibacter crescens BT-1]AMC13138.1 ubiquinone biosynthesis methyltransferase UbiE [Liberibacter crescens]
MIRNRFGNDSIKDTSYQFHKILGVEKQDLVNDIFSKVSYRYDIMNDLMSFGLHRVWKNAMVVALNPPKSANYHVLDVAGGTGDIAFRIMEASEKEAQTFVVDINDSMLSLGKKRARKKGFFNNIHFIEANAEVLPFKSNSFDAYTIAFGIRNMPNINLVLQEAYRVLKYGGRLLVLEFSEVDVPILDRLYDLWSFKAIPRLGKLVAGDDQPYQYLVESIRNFPKQEDFAEMISKAKFSDVVFTNYTGGIVALHSGWKS